MQAVSLPFYQPNWQDLELFKSVFGDITVLKKSEWIQIDIKTGNISKRIFGEASDVHHLREGSLTSENAIAVLLDVATMLTHGKESVEPHCREDKEIIEVASKIFKKIQKTVKEDQWQTLSHDIKYFLKNHLSIERKIEEWDASPAMVKMKSIQMLTHPTPSMIQRLGQDIQRHFRDAATIRFEGLELAQMELSPRFHELPDVQKVIELRAKRLEMILNAFVDKTCTNRLKAVVLKRNWKDIGKGCANETDFAKRINDLYTSLCTPLNGSEDSDSKDMDAEKILFLLRAINQIFYVGPSLGVRGALAAVLQPEARSLNQQQLLKEISDGYGIVFKFDDQNVTIEHFNRCINNDHPLLANTEEQKRTLEKYQTECKYEIKVISVLKAKLDDMSQWESSVHVEIYIPPQSTSGENKAAVDSVLHALRTAGFPVQIKILENNVVWVKAR